MGAQHSKEHWKPDNLAPSCEKCAKQFSVTVRRHHCRSCGKVFCQSCSFRRAAVPTRGIDAEVRLCDACYFAIVTASKGTPGNSFRNGSPAGSAGAGNVQRAPSHPNLVASGPGSDKDSSVAGGNGHHTQPNAAPTKRAVCEGIVTNASKVMIDSSAIRAKETLADVEYTLYAPDLSAATDPEAAVCIPCGTADSATTVLGTLADPIRTEPSPVLQEYAQNVKAIVLAMCDTSTFPAVVKPHDDLVVSAHISQAPSGSNNLADSPPKTAE